MEDKVKIDQDRVRFKMIIEKTITKRTDMTCTRIDTLKIQTREKRSHVVVVDIKSYCIKDRTGDSIQ